MWRAALKLRALGLARKVNSFATNILVLTRPSSKIQFRIPMIFWNQFAASGPRISNTSSSGRYLFSWGDLAMRLLFQSLIQSLNCGLGIRVRSHISGLGSVGQLVFPAVSPEVLLWGVTRPLGSIDCLEFLHRSSLSHY